MASRTQLSYGPGEHADNARRLLDVAWEKFRESKRSVTCKRAFDLMNEGFRAMDRASEHADFSDDEQLRSEAVILEDTYSKFWQAFRRQCLRK